MSNLHSRGFSDRLTSAFKRELITLLSVTVALSLVPLYAWLIAQSQYGPVTSSTAVTLLLATVCNIATIAGARNLHGQLRLKMRRAFNSALLYHGALALVVLLGRLPFSRLMLVVAFAASIALGLLITVYQHVKHRLRVAVLGPNSVDPQEWSGICSIVKDPAENIEDYDVILVSSKSASSPEWSPSITKAVLAGAQVRQPLTFLEEQLGSTPIEAFALDQLSDRTIASYAPIKRLVDVLVVFALAPIIAPVFAVGAITTIATIGRPILFTQERVGRGGKPFTIYKLRTMRALPEGSATATAQDDRRVGRAARVLRRYRVDELPQIVNILKGEMSLIGPRPEWRPLHERYVQAIPSYAYRNLVRPGLTGWAQVRGGYASNLSETRNKLRLDLYYVKHMSPALDFQIALETVWTVLRGAGAR